MSFGIGTHYCLGAALARMTLEEAVRAAFVDGPVPQAAGDLTDNWLVQLFDWAVTVEAPGAGRGRREGQRLSLRTRRPSATRRLVAMPTHPNKRDETG